MTFQSLHPIIIQRMMFVNRPFIRVSIFTPQRCIALLFSLLQNIFTSRLLRLFGANWKRTIESRNSSLHKNH